MLDAFLKVAYEKQDEQREYKELVQTLKYLPREELNKIASGSIKLAFGDDKDWLDKFQGTPLYEQALELEKNKLQMEVQSKQQEMAECEAEDAKSEQRRQRWRAEDGLRLQQRMLELQLRETELQAGGQQPQVTAPESGPPEGAQPPAPEAQPAAPPPQAGPPPGPEAPKTAAARWQKALSAGEATAEDIVSAANKARSRTGGHSFSVGDFLHGHAPTGSSEAVRNQRTVLKQTSQTPLRNRDIADIAVQQNVGGRPNAGSKGWIQELKGERKTASLLFRKLATAPLSQAAATLREGVNPATLAAKGFFPRVGQLLKGSRADALGKSSLVQGGHQVFRDASKAKDVAGHLDAHLTPEMAEAMGAHGMERLKTWGTRGAAGLGVAGVGTAGVLGARSLMGAGQPQPDPHKVAVASAMLVKEAVRYTSAQVPGIMDAAKKFGPKSLLGGFAAQVAKDSPNTERLKGILERTSNSPAMDFLKNRAKQSSALTEADWVELRKLAFLGTMAKAVGSGLGGAGKFVNSAVKHLGTTDNTGATLANIASTGARQAGKWVGNNPGTTAALAGLGAAGVGGTMVTGAAADRAMQRR
jgi:hypothetical protein